MEFDTQDDCDIWNTQQVRLQTHSKKISETDHKLKIPVFLPLNDQVLSQSRKDFSVEFVMIQNLQSFDFKNAVRNRLCPHCMKQIGQNPDIQAVKIIYSNEAKKYFSYHQSCHIQKKTVFTVLSRFRKAQIVSPEELPQFTPTTSFGIIKLRFCHPLVAEPFLQTQKRVQMNDGLGSSIYIINFQGKLIYQPNLVVVPLDQLRLSINVSVREEVVYRNDFVIDLTGKKGQGQFQAVFQTASILLQLVRTNTRLAILIQSLNYKYPYHVRDRLLILKRFVFRLPKFLNQNLGDRLSAVDMPDYSPCLSSSSMSFAMLGQAEQEQESMVLEYQNVKGSVLSLSKSLNGSRSLQKFIKKCERNIFQQIFNQALQNMQQLVKDPYGNYMIQALFLLCTPKEISTIVAKIASATAKTIVDKKGTHSLQALISLTTAEEDWQIIVKSLLQNIVSLSQNNNATHFIQKCINLMSESCLRCLGEPLLNSFVEVVTNAHGLCVLKVFAQKFVKDAQLASRFIQQSQRNLTVLMLDPYGNYFVQHLYQLFSQQRCKRITELIIQSFNNFSVSRFSSSVIEKLIGFLGKEFSNTCKNIIISSDLFADLIKSKNTSILQKLINIPGNQEFLIQLERTFRRPGMDKFRKKITGLSRVGYFTPNTNTKLTSFSDAVKNKPSDLF